MTELKIDDELKNLIRPLTFDERTGLKENLIKNGCLDAIKTWNDFIVDGHNRYEICTENNIEFRTDELSFEDKDEVKIWMIRQQLDKRNVNDYIRTSLCLKMEGIFQEKAIANKIVAMEKARQENPKNVDEQFQKNSSKTVEPMETRAEIAKIANVSTDTVSKVKFIESNATDKQKEDLATDQTSIHKVYTDLKKPIIEAETEQRLEQQRIEHPDTDYCRYTPFMPTNSDITLCPCGCGYGYCEQNEQWYNPTQINEFEE